MCGEKDTRVLAFHHTDPQTKRRRVFSNPTSAARFLDEANKCLVVCQNCHAKIHAHERRQGTFRDVYILPKLPTNLSTTNKNETKRQADRRIRERNKKFTEDLKKSGCIRCGELDVDCLVFHHRDPSTKSETIASLVVRHANVEKIRTEASKCDILCWNCHKIYHSAENCRPHQIKSKTRCDPQLHPFAH